MLSRDYFSNYLKQHDQKTLFLNKIHIVNIIKGSKFNWCSSHKLCIKVGSHDPFFASNYSSGFVSAHNCLIEMLFRVINFFEFE